MRLQLEFVIFYQESTVKVHVYDDGLLSLSEVAGKQQEKGAAGATFARHSVLT